MMYLQPSGLADQSFNFAMNQQWEIKLPKGIEAVEYDKPRREGTFDFDLETEQEEDVENGVEV